MSDIKQIKRFVGEYRDEKCPECNHEYQTGNQIEMNMPYCGDCGKVVLDATQIFCCWCGCKFGEGTSEITSLITTIESQKEEIENLREMKIRRIEVENGAINFSIQGEAGMSFAAILLRFYEDNGGKNFFTFDVERNGMRLSVTIENKHGELTVSEKLNQQSREIESLKAIIETEKAEINDALIDTLDKVHDMESEINSLKAISEIAVKGLKEIACLNVDSAYSAGTIARNTFSEIEVLQSGK